MAQDEGRFGRIDRPRRCGAPQPVRPHVPCQVIRALVYVFAAVCAPLGRFSALLLPTANTEMMALFLRQVAQEFSDYFIIRLVDRAGWPTTPRLNVPENIRLVPQPARRPELNPVEPLWEERREKTLANTSFASLEELENTLCTGLNPLADEPHRLRSLTDFPYLRITSCNAN